MTEVVVIRPGCTDFDEQRRIQGTLDLPLNERGADQVGRLAASLRGVAIDVLYSARSEPARSTAEQLGNELGVPVVELEELTNLNQGLWQGLPTDEVRRMNPKVFRQWIESPESICPPEGETAVEAVERIRRALHRPLRRRESFAVVAPEPLATLISCVVRDVPPMLPDPPCGGGKGPTIAILTCDRDGEGSWTEVVVPAGVPLHAGLPLAGGNAGDLP